MDSAGGRADEQPRGQPDAQARRPRHTGPADPGSYQPPDDDWGPADGPAPPPPGRTAVARAAAPPNGPWPPADRPPPGGTATPGHLPPRGGALLHPHRPTAGTAAPRRAAAPGAAIPGLPPAAGRRARAPAHPRHCRPAARRAGHRPIPGHAAPRRAPAPGQRATTGTATPRRAAAQRAAPRGHRTVRGAATARRHFSARAVPARSPPTGGHAAAWHVLRPRRCILPRDRPGGRLPRPEGRLARGLTAAEGPDPGLPPHAGPAGPGLPARPVLGVEPAVRPCLLAGHERQWRRHSGRRGRTRLLRPGHQRSIGGRDGDPDLGRHR